MDASVRKTIRDRAGHRCEYCLLSQDADPFFSFHVEHIIAKQHGGGDELSNLALACHHCNRHKGPNLSSVDPVTGAIVRLYDPRLQDWTAHFAFEGPQIVGLTPVGRATVRVLAMNAEDQQDLRCEEP